MAFDGRHSELLIVAVFVSITAPASGSILHAIGFRGWQLGLGIIVFVVVGFLLFVLLLNAQNIIDRLKNRKRN
jgi:hypothetical protein